MLNFCVYSCPSQPKNEKLEALFLVICENPTAILSLIPTAILLVEPTLFCRVRVSTINLIVRLTTGLVVYLSPKYLPEAEVFYYVLIQPSPLSIWTGFFKFSSLKLSVWWLDFFPSLNWTFVGYTGSKNPVQTGKKYQFIKLQISNWRIWKIKFR